MTHPDAENAASVNLAQKAGVSEGVFKTLLERHAGEMCDDCSQPRTSRIHTHRKTDGYHLWRPPLAAGDDVALAATYYEMDVEEAQAHWEIATRGYAAGDAMGMLAFVSLIRHASRYSFELLGGDEAARHMREGHAGGYRYLITDKTGEKPPTIMFACRHGSTSRRSQSQLCQVCRKRAHQFLCDHPTEAVCTKCNGKSELGGGICTRNVCRHCLGSRKEPCSKRLCKGCTRTNGKKEGDINRVDYCDEHAAAHGFVPPAPQAARGSRRANGSRVYTKSEMARARVKCGRCRDTRKVWDSSGTADPLPERMADEQIPCPSCCGAPRKFSDVAWTRSPYEFACDGCKAAGRETVIQKGARALFDKKRSEAFCQTCGEQIIEELKNSLASRA